MRLLRVLRLGPVGPGRLRQVGVAVAPADRLPDPPDGLARDLHAVGPHIGDEALPLAFHLDAFVELLGDSHGAPGGEAELAGGLLLQGRGGERRLRAALDPLGRDGRHPVAAGPDRGDGLRRRRLGAERELVQLRAVEGREPRGDALPPRRVQVDVDRPVLARPEGLDRDFAFADQPQRDRLHPPGRAGARKLAPQHRREREPHQIVEGAARLVGVDEVVVEVARGGHRLQHRALGDFGEHHPLDGDAVQQAAPLQHVQDVPRDRLALAVRVGREVEPPRAAQGLADGAEGALGALVDLPIHGEGGVGADGAVLRRQVAHVPVGGHDRVVRSEIPVEGRRLGGRFDDDDFHPATIAGGGWAMLPSGRARHGCPAGVPRAPPVRAPAGWC